MMEKPQDGAMVSLGPRVILCGLRGGSGKTVVTIGMIGALRQRGLRPVPFKKGPDYIDPQWLALAAGRPCRNLDAYLMSREQILGSMAEYGREGDIAVVEGNRGLFDGMDENGTYSAAELAMQSGTPTILAVDCSKTTRTAAAMVLGCKLMEPSLPLRGAILNQIASSRQEAVIRAAVEKETGLPVLGAFPRLRDFAFDERHLGLHPPAEHSTPQETVDRLAECAAQNIDIEAILKIAAYAPPLEAAVRKRELFVSTQNEEIRIGIVRDEAFHFYYPENLEALEERGAQLVEIHSMRDAALPPIEALYIGGGFPETHGAQLADNAALRSDLRRKIDGGLPVLAECGGLIYLSETLIAEGSAYPMTGVFPVTFTVSKRPQGHGYTAARVERENPFFPVGTELRGHEFRYCAVKANRYGMTNAAFRLTRGFGFDGERDGLVYKNCLASFCHHHALGTREWAEGLMRSARAFKRKSAQ
ncbi:MAG: cobyrinate a,c-diamide synthase [Candidatus Omnitrophota bacterium]